MIDKKFTVFVNSGVSESAEGGPLILLGLSDRGLDMAPAVFNIVKESLPDKPFTLAAFTSTAWGSDFSPWSANGAEESEKFAGEGQRTIETLSEAIKDELTPFAGHASFIAGYSLAGLFSLWSLYYCDLFDGCACCSGSLWFEGWKDFVDSNKIKKPGLVYLSLGGKEEKSKNPVMATIGEATRYQEKILEMDSNVKKKILVMNPGGHFASPDKRVAKGIIWLLENYYK